MIKNHKPNMVGVLAILIRFLFCVLVCLDNVHADVPLYEVADVPANRLVFDIPENIENATLAPYLQYQIEKSNQVYPDDIIHNQEFNSFFKPIPNPDANFGYVTQAHWFKLSLQNSNAKQDEPRTVYLELDYPFLDDIQAFFPSERGEHNKYVVGDMHPFHVRSVDLPVYLFPVILTGAEVHHLYFRIQTSTSIQVPLTLWSEIGFIEHNANSQYWLGIFYGVMLAMLLYNAFIGVSVKDNAYILYILYIASIIVMNLVVTGVAYQKLWPNSSFLANYGFPLACPTAMFFALQFTRSFLQTKEFSQRIDWLLQFMSCIVLVMLALPFIIGQFYATVIAVLIPIPVCLLVFSAGLHGALNQHRRAFFFVAAWGCLVVGFIARALMQFDILPNTTFTQHGVQIGATAEVILLSLALADRINTEKAERLAAVKDKLDALTKKQAVEEELLYQSCHDQLTGAPNRSLYIQCLQERIDILDPEKNRLMVCTVHFSSFHDINFTLGHQSGDHVLVQAARDLNAEVANYPGACEISAGEGSHSYIGMMEGVNFSFMFQVDPRVSEHEILGPLVEKLSHPFQYEDMLLDLGAQIGVSAWPNDDDTAAGLTRKSMIAVRAAKWSKLPLMSYDLHIDKYSEVRLSLMGELIKAINNDELVLYYQPKVDLKTGVVVSMEALVRWQHPQRGLLGPGDFVDIAESTGIIQPMTQWVMNSAIEFCSSLRRDGYDLSVAVNISVRNLLSDQLVPKALEIADRWFFPKDRLILEVVESAVIDDMEQAIR